MALGFFLLSALAKGIALTLPVVLLACAWWQRGRITRRDLLRVVPFLVIGLGMVGVEVIMQHLGAGDTAVRSDSLLGRAAVAGCAVWFYAWKAIWPANLAFIYPRWNIDEGNLLSYLPGVLLAALLALAWWRRNTWGRPVVMLIVCYVALLLPVLGFVNIIFMKYSLVADHWQYAALIVPCAAAAALLTTLGRHRSPLARSGRGAGGEGETEHNSWATFQKPLATYALGLVLLAILAVLTFRQSRMFAGEETLYRTAIEQNPGCWLAQNNLGNLLTSQGQWLASRGRTSEATIRYREAITQLRNAVKSNPRCGDAYVNLGIVLGCLGRMDEARASFQDALKINPDSTAPIYNLAMALVKQGQFEEAIQQYRRALKIDPNDLPTLNNLAWLRATCSDSAFRDGNEAIKIAEQACRLSKRRVPMTLDTLAAAYAETGRFHEAVQAARAAIDLAKQQNNPGSRKLSRRDCNSTRPEGPTANRRSRSRPARAASNATGARTQRKRQEPPPHEPQSQET